MHYSHSVIKCVQRHNLTLITASQTNTHTAAEQARCGFYFKGLFCLNSKGTYGLPWPWHRLALRSGSDSAPRLTVPPSQPCGEPSLLSEMHTHTHTHRRNEGIKVTPVFSALMHTELLCKLKLLYRERETEGERYPPLSTPNPP